MWAYPALCIRSNSRPVSWLNRSADIFRVRGWMNNNTLRSPDTQYSEGAVLHAQSKLRSIVVEGNTANRLLHVTASQESVVRKTPQPERQTGRERDRGVISADQRRSSVSVYNQPDGAVVTPGDSNWLFWVQVQCPQLTLTVTLNQQNRFIPVSDHNLKDLTVLCPRQDAVSLPADAADGQTWDTKVR